MGLTDPFSILHDGRVREIDIQSIGLNTPTGDDPSMTLYARTRIVNGGELDEQAAKLKDRDFTEAEFLSAAQAQLGLMGITMTNQQVAELILGIAEQACRIRWELA